MTGYWSRPEPGNLHIGAPSGVPHEAVIQTCKGKQVLWYCAVTWCTVAGSAFLNHDQTVNRIPING